MIASMCLLQTFGTITAEQESQSFIELSFFQDIVYLSMSTGSSTSSTAQALPVVVGEQAGGETLGLTEGAREWLDSASDRTPTHIDGERNRPTLVLKGI